MNATSFSSSSAHLGFRALRMIRTLCLANFFLLYRRYTATIRPISRLYRNISTFHTLLPTPETMLTTLET